MQPGSNGELLLIFPMPPSGSQHTEKEHKQHRNNTTTASRGRGAGAGEQKKNTKEVRDKIRFKKKGI